MKLDPIDYIRKYQMPLKSDKFGVKYDKTNLYNFDRININIVK